MIIEHFRRVIGFAVLFFIVISLPLIFQACNPSPTINETEPNLQGTASIQPTSTHTPAPSPTLEPPLVVLITPPGADPEVVAQLENVLVELTDLNGMRLESRPDMSQDAMPDDASLVVVLGPDPGIAEMAAARPGINFLAVGIPGLSPGGNLSLVGSNGDRPDRQGFIAGYLAAVVTKHWRVGIISVSDSASGLAARNGFLNGVVFFCGLCRPAFPPFLQYPQYYDVGTGAGEDELATAADYLIEQGIETVYVSSGLNEGALLDYLVESEVKIIGSVTPEDRFLNSWIATIRPDYASGVKKIWPRLLNGETGISVEIPIVLNERNQTLFSSGRQRLVERILADLLTNYIGTGVDPITGETP